MGSAGERRNAEPRLVQHARDAIDMRRLATMRGAGGASSAAVNA
jgi:hypothetical protein